MHGAKTNAKPSPVGRIDPDAPPAHGHGNAPPPVGAGFHPRPDATVSDDAKTTQRRLTPAPRAPYGARRVVGDADPYGWAKTATIRNTVTNGAPGSVRPTMGVRKPVTPGGGGTPPLRLAYA